MSKSEIFNADQSSQYTSKEYVTVLQNAGIKISMDGKGRVHDNIIIERLLRSVKYEEVYLKRYHTGDEAIEGMDSYLTFYNNERPHQSLGYKTPRSWYMATTEKSEVRMRKRSNSNGSFQS